MRGKKLRRVDECINILLRFTRDVAFERLRRKCKGNDSYRSSCIVRSHKACAAMSPQWLEERVTEENEGWRVRSLKAGVTQEYKVVVNSNNSCSGCELMCTVCRICVHEYVCSCHDHLIHGNMCKHIHAVAIVFLIETPHSREEEIVQSIRDHIEAICDKATDECHVGKEVEVQDMWRPVSLRIEHFIKSLDNCEVPESIVTGALKFLEILRKDMPLPSSSLTPPNTPPNDATSETSSLLPSLTPSPYAFPTPSTKKIDRQRRLLNFTSTKKKPLPKKNSLVKPTFHQQGSLIASMSLRSSVQVLNVHSESDHSYLQMTTDDVY